MADLMRWESGFPFMRRFMREFDTLFNRTGLERWPLLEAEPSLWAPDVEVLEKGQELIIRADVPGMKKDEIKIEIAEGELILEGERKREKEEKGEGYYRSERSYGTFRRVIPLPEGVKAETAKAVITDGVLEVRMPIAKVEEKRRRLEIGDAKAEKAATKAA